MAGSTSGVRRSRTGWAAKGALTLTDRDLQLFYFLAVTGIARTRDLVRLFFGARATAIDRLRKLFVAGYLQCFVPTLASDNLYALTERGREALCAAKALDPATVRVVRKLPAKREHLFAILEVRLHLALACRSHPDYALTSFDTDADLAAERHASMLELVPDARVTLTARRTGAPLRFFLECDRATENTKWLVCKKLSAYATAAATRVALYGVVDPLIILVVSGLRRARSIAARIKAERIHPRVVFALASDLNEHTVLGAAYARVEELCLPSPTNDVRGLFSLSLLP